MDDHTKLHGYSITMDGEIVAQEWPSEIDEYIGDDLTWEDLLPNHHGGLEEYRIASELRAA
jgi:hypothetical protein